MAEMTHVEIKKALESLSRVKKKALESESASKRLLISAKILNKQSQRMAQYKHLCIQQDQG